MSPNKLESESRMVPKEQIDSPPFEEGGSSGGGRLKKGPWTAAEDVVLRDYVKIHGEGNWNAVQKHSGLARCGKSCRLRWANHLRPNLKKGVITPAEELKIVELHAKMGNKWARMAAHLPGRTDNEIKNFWNTRIKRLQRIGMPPYPPEMQFDASNEGLQTEGAGEFSNVHKDQNDFLQGSGYNMNPVLLFDNHKAAMGPLSYTPFLGSTPMTRMMTQGFGSKSLAFANPTGDQLKRPRESELAPGFPSTLPAGLSTFQQFSTMPAEKIHKGIGFSSPYDPAPFSSRNLNPYATFSGSHALLNGNTTTSQSSTGKLELPSLQYACGWLASASAPPLQPISSYIPSPATTYIQSPANSIQSDCISIRNNGLLDSLLPQSSTVTYTQSPETSIQSDCISTRNNGLLGSLLPLSQALENNDPQSPLGFTASSLFNDSPLISSSSFDDLFTSKTTSGSELMLGDTELVSTPGEQDGPARSECLRPDALFEADWHANSSGVQKDDYLFNEVVTSFLGEDLCSEDNQMASGGSSSSFTQDMILQPYQWNTAPRIGTMSQNL